MGYGEGNFGNFLAHKVGILLRFRLCAGAGKRDEGGVDFFFSPIKSGGSRSD